MSNAAKHRKKAAEFEQLKQIDRAIASYIKSIEESEGAGEDVDVALFNKVGDLALRQGRVPDAITYYERAVEHYATSGLFNNAIALCNKILRSAPGRANVYFTLGRICARKGLRGDATKNFLEYATRMREEGKVEEGMRALAEISDLSPELTEVRKLVDEYAVRAGIALPRRMTPPIATPAVRNADGRPDIRDEKSQDLVFIHVDYGQDEQLLATPRERTPARSRTPVRGRTPVDAKPAVDPLRAALIEPGPGLQLLRDRATPPIPVLAVDATPIVPVDPLEGLELAPAMTLDGLEANGDFGGGDVATLDGLTVDETVEELAPTMVPTPIAGMPLVPHELEAVAFGHVELLDDVQVEEFEHAADDPSIAKIIATETPLYVDAIVVDPTPLATAAIVFGEHDASANASANAETIEPLIDAQIEPLEVEAVPELDEAIAAGVATSEAVDLLDVPEIEVSRITPLMLDFDLEAVEELALPTRPPFRIDPHDFILPGELPPLLLDDALVDAGLERAISPRRTPRAPTPWIVPPVDEPRRDTPVFDTPAYDTPATFAAAEPARADEAADDLLDVSDELAALAMTTPNIGVEPEAAPLDVAADPSDAEPHERSLPVDATAIPDAPTAEATAVVSADDDVVELPSSDELDAAADAWAPEAPAAAPPVSARPMVLTPALPIAAVAAEATIVASSRRDALRAAVSRLPKNWLLRRRLAEALLESGERDEALAELETARQGLIDAEDLAAAADIGDEMVHVSPESVAYHQRRVELSVRMHDLQRLRIAYLDLADALVRLGEEGRARAVYARVLEIDPLDDRARTALGAAAPPPPPPAARPDDEFVDLTTWLKDDDGQAGDTRLRMREPVISGDEQADFDELLRHFKEGVARSLGEDDFESHYDLGVAYKEMGLLDDAIAEFQKALRSRGNRLPAYEALGQCFVEQGRHQVAATVLSRALHEPGLGDEQRVGVLYLLAFSCEALQRFDEARSYYQRVYATDIQFRDAAARLAALEQVAR